jgi:hypothetical protein
MEQHPIPQQISSYEFKLVGDMTLKQFLKAAAGIILAMLINSTKLMVFVKWPLMFLFGGGGILLAFVPFEDRPLESWVFSFIKSIYSPTIYTYKRKSNKNWLDLDLTKNTKQSEEDIVIKGRGNSSLLGSKIKDSISVIGAKGLNAEEKKENIEAVQTTKIPKLVLEEKPVAVGVKTEEKAGEKKEDWRDQKMNLNLKTEKLGATGRVLFGAIPMPDIPDVPNVIVGMATNIEGKIVDGVIVEIQDENGNPSRVLKTNSLGQFKTTTPLASGRYLIIAEKDGYNFDRVNIDLKGQIVQPVKIIANS